MTNLRLGEMPGGGNGCWSIEQPTGVRGGGPALQVHSSSLKGPHSEREESTEQTTPQNMTKERKQRRNLVQGVPKGIRTWALPEEGSNQNSLTLKCWPDVLGGSGQRRAGQ